MFKDILDFLALGWVGSLIGIAGIPLAVLTYVLTRQRKILAFRARGFHLIGNADPGFPSDVTVQYRGQTVTRLTRSLVIVWNQGEVTIGGGDIVPSDPLVVEVEADAKILSVKPIKVSRPVTKVSGNVVSESPNKAEIKFDFLDSMDGAVLEILHTGKMRHPRMTGTVRGIPLGPKNYGPTLPGATNKSPRVRRSSKALAIAAIVIGIGLSLIGLILPGVVLVESIQLPFWIKYPLIVLSVLYAGLGFILFWLIRRRYPRSLHVEELE